MCKNIPRQLNKHLKVKKKTRIAAHTHAVQKHTNKCCQVLFLLHRLYKLILTRFSNMHDCQGHEDYQEYVILCEKLRDSLPIVNRQLLEEVKYSYFFSNIHDQLRITNVYQLLIEARERIRDTRPRVGLPGHSSGPHDV